MRESAMLVIRDEQLHILNRPFVASFRAVLREYAQTDYPQAVERLGPTGVEQLIDEAIGRAPNLHLELEEDICDLFGIMLEFGPAFDQQEWAAAILQDDADTARGRLSRLAGWASALGRLQPFLLQPTRA